MIVSFTGHRPDKLGGYGEPNPIKDRVQEVLASLLRARMVTSVISGMALGFDQWACETALAVGVPVHAAVPFDGQESRWPEESQAKYRELLSRVASVTVVSPGGYEAWKMHARNRWMVDRCNEVWALWNGDATGGTKSCIDYAISIRRPVFNLWGM